MLLFCDVLRHLDGKVGGDIIQLVVYIYHPKENSYGYPRDQRQHQQAC